MQPGKVPPIPDDSDVEAFASAYLGTVDLYYQCEQRKKTLVEWIRAQGGGAGK